MAFVRSPDLISIELLQIGDALELTEPWKSILVLELGNYLPTQYNCTTN